MSTTTVTLETGQFNLLVSGLSLASSACREANFETRELIGHPEDFSALQDQIVAQLPGEAPAAASRKGTPRGQRRSRDAKPKADRAGLNRT